MAVKNKFIHFNTRSGFDSKVPNPELNSADGNEFYNYIVFIRDTKEIYTHGQFYGCSEFDNSETDNSEIIKMIEDLNNNLNELSLEVEESQEVAAASLNELHENKADKSDLENLSTEVYENEEITAAALSDIYEKLDNVAFPDMGNYVEAATYQTDIATLSSSDETLQKNIDDVVASSLLKTEQTLTDEEKAQVRTNIGAVSIDHIDSVVGNISATLDAINGEVI